MESLAIWKLILDGMLVLALTYFCMKFARSSGSQLSARALGLETGLRALIKDADQAGRSLNAELARRQADLEKLLFDIRSVENRLEAGMQKAEALRNHLSEAASSSYVSSPTPNPVPEYRAPLKPEVSAARYPDRTSLEESLARTSILDSRSKIDREVVKETIEAPLRKPEQVQVNNSQPARNIYGEIIAPSERMVEEPIADRVEVRESKIQASTPYQKPVYQLSEDQVQAPKASGLKVEREVQTSKPNSFSAQAEAHQQLQLIYDEAERLLKAGENLKQVSIRTSLPIDEVRMLSQLIDTETEAHEDVINGESGSLVSNVDERLGVLSGTRRSIQTA